MKIKIAEKRKEKKLTQPQVAEQLNISYTQLQGYEHGRRIPSVEVALRLAHALECKVEDLFELED